MRTNQFPYAAVIAFVIGIGLSIALMVSMATRADGPLPRELGTLERTTATKGYGQADPTEASSKASVSSFTHDLP